MNLESLFNPNPAEREFEQKVFEKLEQVLRNGFGVSVEEAIMKNWRQVLFIQNMIASKLLDSHEGQKLLFNGLTETSMIYQTIARQDQIVRYVGRNPLNPFDIVDPNLIQTMEKDAECCTCDGCAINGSPKWCVTTHYVHGLGHKELCNFCANQIDGAEIDKCLSNDPECTSCANGKVAKEIHADSGYFRDIPTRVKGEVVAK